MLLFEDEKNNVAAPPKPELTPTTAYLDEEHVAMLDSLIAAGRGKLNKSEVVRQCLRLGYKTHVQREAGKNGGGL